MQEVIVYKKRMVLRSETKVYTIGEPNHNYYLCCNKIKTSIMCWNQQLEHGNMDEPRPDLNQFH